ncbi:ABC transporter permease [Planktothricoides raciborskii]|uniref:ABC transporter permease n=2 Tax=Planktothricoides raciborskii TaxID=132608 RepID=A0AAU8JFI2_9CYAN|nr:ABC transporter permease [Planktothricoides raciborskii]MBD2544098.1 ABC transporter permease [Planktothricoides raciborskii FACHB-1370]MBD2582583.1 ABC transporter permease [Planktothricoides raciborskii FACHB-1261]
MNLKKFVEKWLDSLSDINPQLFREVKGRLKTRNVAIAAAISLVSQIILVGTYGSQLPNSLNTYYSHYYCLETYREINSGYVCLTDTSGQVLINWDLWWLDIFLWLSFAAVFALFVAGTYMLISDLAKEEKNGTLNFIRVSPRSTQTILLGKLFGVPILLYLGVLLAIPLHTWAGLSAQIPLGLIIGFDIAVIAGCIFFYSLAMLFGLTTAYLGGFQTWLGSGLVFGCLAFTSVRLERYSTPVLHSPIDWLNLFNPAILLPNLVAKNLASLQPAEHYFNYGNLSSWQWFYWPLGASAIAIFCLMVVNYCLWTYAIWQGLSRRFPNPTATIISKRQSYNLVALFQLAMLGFALQEGQPYEYSEFIRAFSENLGYILLLNLLLFIGLIAALSPHRQTVQDWARYSHSNSFKSLWQDLVWGEKSPAIVAIALNAIFAAGLLVPWILLWPNETIKTAALGNLLLFISSITIYAVIAQLMLLMKTQKRGIWAASIVETLTVLPLMVFVLFSLEPDDQPFLWLFSAFYWAATEHISFNYVLLAFVGQFAILGGLTLVLKRRVNHLGQSATQALLKPVKLPTI